MVHPVTSSGLSTPRSYKPHVMLAGSPRPLSGLQARARAAASVVIWPSSSLRRTIVAASNHKDEGVPPPAPQAQAAVVVEEEESLYMEPLIRNFVLGASAGALAEMVHVLLTTAEVAEGAGGLFMLPAIVPLVSEALAPLFLWDHVVALGVWAMLYLVEAKTLSGIISKHPLDPNSAAQEARTTMTLPKRMLPMSMVSAKRTLFKLMSGMRRTPAAANAAVNAFTPIDFARELERRERASTPTGGAGTATIERPRAPEPTRVSETPLAPPPTPASVPAPKVAPVSRRASLKKGSKGGSGLRPTKSPGAPVKKSADETLEKKRDKELRDRKAYLKNMWYGVAMSANLKADKPMEVKVMGRTVVLFRDENGKVCCMENLCSHRGAPLGQGWMKKVNGHNCVVCPYHAWAYDGEGRLKDVPTSIQGQLPKRPMQDTYPVEEKGGFIWLFFGSKSMPADERPPIPYIPELDDPKWRAVYGEMEFKAPHWSTYDNALDMAHIHYVHNGSFGNPNKPEIMDMNIERDTFGITGSFKIFNKPVNKLWEWTRVPHVPVELKAWVPMTSAVRITLGRGIQMITFVNTVPIDEHTSINKFCLIRNFAIDPAMDGFVRDNMMTILTEDKVMVETVRPEDMAREFSLAADLPQIAFRQLRQEWVDMGYAVDPKDTLGPHGSLNL